MSKTGGLGDGLLIGGYDLSGDIGSLDSVHGGPALLDVTSINDLAHERIGGQRDGSIEYTGYFNPSSSQAHPVLSLLPTADETASYLRGTTLGNAAACCVGKQIDYAPTRGNDGALTVKSSVTANGYGLEWGKQLTAGLRTDTAATSGSAYDNAAATTHGCQVYIQVTAYTGVDCNIVVQSASDSIFTTPQTEATYAVTAAHTTTRIAGSNSSVNRYWRANTTTSGGITTISFSVVVVINQTAVVF